MLAGTLTLLGALLFCGSALAAEAQTVDLHCHPFMDKGMSGLVMSGNFDGPLKAKDWTALFASQINAETLERSGDAIVVVSLYAHPVLAHPARQSIRDQIAATERFVAAHPGWIIARDARQAREALAHGQRVLVLALERASNVLETEDDLEEFIDRLGIRIVTFLHLADDRFGGVAIFQGLKGILDPGAWLRNIFHGSRDSDGVPINTEGMTAEGRRFLRALVARHVWIDLTHASDRAQLDAIPVLEHAGQPLLYTHTALRRYVGAERGLSDWQLRKVRETGGILGLLPSEDLLEHTPVDARFCPRGCAPKACAGSVPAMATQYAELVSELGAGSVMLGSDFNGGIVHLKPACRTDTSLDGPRGLWNIGQTADLWNALRNVGAPVPQASAQVDAFLEAWQRVLSN